MSDGNKPERNHNKSKQIKTKRRVTPVDNCTSNLSDVEKCLDNCSVTNAESSRNAVSKMSAASRTSEDRYSSFTIRTPLILQARVSKSNWYEPSKASKVDLFKDILQYSNVGCQSPYFSEEDLQPGLSTSVLLRKKIKTIHKEGGEKKDDSDVKTILSSQGTKRKTANGNNLSAPKSKRLLQNSDKQHPKKLTKPQSNNSHLDRSRSVSKTSVKKITSSKSKSSNKSNYPVANISSATNLYFSPKRTIQNVPIYQDVICTCSNRQRSQSTRSSKTKSAQKRKKRRKSSKSSIKKGPQQKKSMVKRKKSNKNSVKSRKSNKTSRRSSMSRTKFNQRRSSKNKVGPKRTPTKRIGVKMKRNEAKEEITTTKRESKVKRLQPKKAEPSLKVTVKKRLQEKKTIKKAALATKRRSRCRKQQSGTKTSKNANPVCSDEVYPRKVSDTNHPPDLAKVIDKIESLREQGDSYNTVKERLVMPNADVEIQCCLLTSSECLPSTCSQSMVDENVNSHNFSNELSPKGKHLVNEEGKTRNLVQEANAPGKIDERLTFMDDHVEANSQSQLLNSNLDASFFNSGITDAMEEQVENSINSFRELWEHDEHLPELQNDEISNLDEQITTRKETQSLMNVNDRNFTNSQSHPLILAQDHAMEYRIADTMTEKISNPSNSFNNSMELNESLSNLPGDKSRNFGVKAYSLNETKANILNICDHIDISNQSHSVKSVQDLQFDSGIVSEMVETTRNLGNCFSEPSERFSDSSGNSNRNFDEQMNVRNRTKESLIVINEPIEAQHNSQSFTGQNFQNQSGVATDVVEGNTNSSKLNGHLKKFTTRELRNVDEQIDASNKVEQSLLSSDETETGSQSHSIVSFQSLSPISFAGAKEMRQEENAIPSSFFNESKGFTEQISDLNEDRRGYLHEESSTNQEIEQSSMNQAEADSQPQFKASVSNLTLAAVVEKVMKENIEPLSSSKKSNGQNEQLSRPTEDINRNSDEQVNTNNKSQKAPLSFKQHNTPQSESMALLPYKPSSCVSLLRENTTYGFLPNESNGFNEQLSNSPDETTNINELGVSLLELVSLSLSQGASPEDITCSADQIQEIETQIRTLRCIYIQEQDTISEHQLENENSSAEDNTVPVNYIRTSTSLLLEGLPSWLKYLYNNLFRSKK